MGCCSIELSLTNLVLLGVLFFAGKKLLKFFERWKIEKMLEKWDDAPKDKLILHTVWRCKTLPGISPYGMKLETYLRMAKIPYELDTKDAMGPKGKLPWITYNGVHVADSHLCIQFLNKKFGINLNKNVTKEQAATAYACRIMLENHWMWGIVQYRWIENANTISRLMKIPTIFKLLIPFRSHQIKQTMISQGIGKHTPTEIYQMTEADLHTVSALLGSKKFFGGDEPCEDDCAIFGGLSQAVWGMPGSSFEKLCNGELKNLKEYSERMKERYWQDWESCLDKS
ncbi:hypothetical protein Ocin01_18495 [Orchesella cincta]|uniref:Failed axon connections n=1 Tax=Orchesella cincta TaxID=48709 RepID=A0A1D2M5D2_ORCCI|nr:hypothetical protein Ocin01_18495 [Orchesella cincta]